IHTMVIIGALLTIAPFIWMILPSLKTYAESVQVSAVIMPSQFMWSNYTEIFNLLPFLKFMMNTVIVTIARTIGQLFLCSLAAYAFARIQF
ncbi:carbohydrate ABC transporter permease, partial [Klebsiella pneumoniae]|nr:carbohydrate ABC transporter permease [Klebsiella pneumoniae]